MPTRQRRLWWPKEEKKNGDAEFGKEGEKHVIYNFRGAFFVSKFSFLGTFSRSHRFLRDLNFPRLWEELARLELNLTETCDAKRFWGWELYYIPWNWREFRKPNGTFLKRFV